MFKLKNSKFIEKWPKVFYYLEVGLAIATLFIVALGCFYLIHEVYELGVIYFNDPDTDIRSAFEDLLANILLLVVAIELAVMLIKRTPDSVIDIMFFVVARKIIVKNEGTFDLFIGVVTLAALFAIKKYLIHKDSSDNQQDPVSIN